MKNITIIDPQYKQWIKELSLRYRKSQIKAAVRVNQEKLLFNWELGHDIVEMHVEERWGEHVIDQLGIDLKNELPGVEGFLAPISTIVKNSICFILKEIQLSNKLLDYFRFHGGIIA